MSGAQEERVIGKTLHLAGSADLAVVLLAARNQKTVRLGGGINHLFCQGERTVMVCPDLRDDEAGDVVSYPSAVGELYFEHGIRLHFEKCLWLISFSETEGLVIEITPECEQGRLFFANGASLPAACIR